MRLPILKIALAATIACFHLVANAQNNVQVSIYLADINIDMAYGANSTIRSNLKKGVLAVKEFLSVPSFNSETQKTVFKFIQGLFPDHLLFEIYCINKHDANGVFFIVNSYQYFEKSNEKDFQGFFTIFYDFNKSQIMFPVYDSTYHKYDFKNVTFYSIKMPDKKAANETGTYIENTENGIKAFYSGFVFPKKK